MPLYLFTVLARPAPGVPCPRGLTDQGSQFLPSTPVPMFPLQHNPLWSPVASRNPGSVLSVCGAAPEGRTLIT